MAKNLRVTASSANTYLRDAHQAISNNQAMASSANAMGNIARKSPGALKTWAKLWQNNRNLQTLLAKNNLYRNHLNFADPKDISSYATQVNQKAQNNINQIKNQSGYIQNNHIYNSIAETGKAYQTASSQAVSFSTATSYVNSHNLSQNTAWLNRRPALTSQLYLANPTQMKSQISKDFLANRETDSMLSEHNINVANRSSSNVTSYEQGQKAVAKLSSNVILKATDTANLRPLNNGELRSTISHLTSTNSNYASSLGSLMGISKARANSSQTRKSPQANQKDNMTTARLETSHNVDEKFWKQIKQAQDGNKTITKPNLLNISQNTYLHEPKTKPQTKTKKQVKQNWSTLASKIKFNDPVMKSYLKAIQKQTSNSTKVNKQVASKIQNKLVDNDLARNYLTRSCGIHPRIVNYMIKRGLVRGLKGKTPRVEFLQRIPRNANEAHHFTPYDKSKVNTFLTDINLNNSEYKPQNGTQEERVCGANYVDLKPSGVTYTDENNKTKHPIYEAKQRTLDNNSLKHYGFNFRTGTGKDKLYVFSNPENAISYIQTHLNDHHALRNASFMALNKPNDAKAIQNFIDAQAPQKGQFNHIILSPDNNMQGDSLVQRIASEFGERKNYVQDRQKNQKLITTELPVSVNRSNNEMVTRDSNNSPKGNFDKSWNDELKRHTMQNHNFERPGAKLNLDKYGLMTTRQAMINMSRDDSERFDTIAHLYAQVEQNRNKGFEKIDNNNPRIVAINKIEHQMPKSSQQILNNYMRSSGQYMPAKDIVRYTNYQMKFASIKNNLLGSNQIQHDLKQNYRLSPIQQNVNQTLKQMPNQNAKQLYSTAIMATANSWRRRISFYYHNQPMGRKAYYKRHQVNLKPLSPVKLGQYEGQMLIAQQVRQKSYQQLIKKYPNEAKKVLRISPDLQKLNVYDTNHKAKIQITGQDAVKDLKTAYDVNRKITPYQADKIIGDKKLQQLVQDTKVAEQQGQNKIKNQRAHKVQAQRNKQKQVQAQKAQAKQEQINKQKAQVAKNNQQKKQQKQAQIQHQNAKNTKAKSSKIDLNKITQRVDKASQTKQKPVAKETNHKQHSPLTKQRNILQQVHPQDRHAYAKILTTYDKFVHTSNRNQKVMYRKTEAEAYGQFKSQDDRNLLYKMNLRQMPTQKVDKLVKKLHIQPDLSKQQSSNVVNNQKQKPQSIRSNAQNVKSTNQTTANHTVHNTSKQHSKLTQHKPQVKPMNYTSQILQHANNYRPTQDSNEIMGANALRTYNVAPQNWQKTVQATKLLGQANQTSDNNLNKKDTVQINHILHQIPKNQRANVKGVVNLINNFENGNSYIQSLTNFTKHALNPSYIVKPSAQGHVFSSNNDTGYTKQEPHAQMKTNSHRINRNGPSRV